MKWKGSQSRGFLASVLALGLVLLLSANLPTLAQDRRQPKTKPSGQSTTVRNSPSVVVDADEDYRIGVSDVIDIKVEDAEKLNGTFRVHTSGTIVMNYLKRISVVNKTTEEVEKLIADGLRDRYLKDPQVHVTVSQPNSRSYFVQGAVNNPGMYMIEGRVSLFKLISTAGGMKENCGSTAYIIRESKAPDQEKEAQPTPALSETTKPQPLAANASAAPPDQDSAEGAQYDIFSVNVSRFMKGQITHNPLITPGDTVYIPVTDVFFIAGEVVQSGEFSLKEGTTLRQAMSLAQGTKFEAAASRTIIVRVDPATGKRQEIPVDLDAVMKGKKSDMAIMADDIIIVPNSRVKSISGAFLKAFGVSAARIPIP
jgi:polysaccharide export outer membrane protein